MLIRRIPTLVLAGAGCLALFYGLFSSNQATANCTNGQPARPEMQHSTNASLRKLASLEAYCHGYTSSHMMLFAPMPKTEAEASEYAAGVAHNLQEFNRFSVTPIVVFEPDISTANSMNKIAEPEYDTILEHYYKELRQFDISSTQMGIWVILPEANTPTWGTTNADLFQMNVKKIVSLHKKYFSASKVSLLLDGHTYPDYDTSWANGKMVSLLPYVEDLPQNFIDVIGLQGFPRKAQKNDNTTADRLNVDSFLPGKLLEEAAEKLNTSSVWFNTGTFREMYVDDPTATVSLTPEERRRILTEILSQASSLQSTGRDVAINIFAENKSHTAEHVDWSYPELSLHPPTKDDVVLRPFLSAAHHKKIPISLYDH